MVIESVPVNITDEQLLMVQDNYWSGRNMASQRHIVDLEQVIGKKIDQLIINDVPPNVIDIVVRCIKYRERGLEAARLGYTTLAQQLFLAARKIIALNPMPRECYLLLCAYQEAAEAYLDYRLGDFDLARERITDGLTMDDLLINEYGYELLEFHRMKLLHNLIRIDVRSGNWEGVMDLGSSLFDELAGSSRPWLAKLCKQGLLPSNMLEDIAVFFADKFLVEMAQVLAPMEEGELYNLFSYARPFTEDTAVKNPDLFSYHYMWLRMKKDFVDRDDNLFLDLAGAFLARGKHFTGLLWHAAVRDIVSLCHRLNTPVALRLSEELTEDALTFKLPPPLQLTAP